MCVTHQVNRRGVPRGVRPMLRKSQNASPFGDDGGGNFFCLDLSSPSTKVLLRYHETLELLHEAGEFEPWLAGSPASWQSGVDDGSSR